MFGFKNKLWPIALAIIAIGYCLIESQGTGDFFIFLRAAGDLHEPADIYRKDYIDGFHYYYSVLFALFLKPFFYLPFFWVKFYWLILNFCLYLHLLHLLYISNYVKVLNEKQQRVFLLLVFFFSFRFLHENLHASQITILILWCCVYGLYLITKGREFSGSAILALGINLKLLPVVLLPYLLYRGYFKSFILTILFYGLGMLLPSVLIGHEYNMALLKTWLWLINPTEQRHILDVDERSFHSLTTLLATLLVKNVPDLYALNLRRNIADVSLETLSAILLTVRMALVALTLYFLRWPPFKKASTRWGGLSEIAYILLLVPLIFPHQQHYAFLFIVPSLAMILYYLITSSDRLSKTKRIFVVSIVTLIYILVELKIILGEFNRYYEHFKILTYGALLLIPLLMWVSRKEPNTLPDS